MSDHDAQHRSKEDAQHSCKTAPEHGVAAGRTIREYLNAAADAIERTGEELVKHAQAELERAKEAQTESKNIADGFRREAELKEREILTQTTRARDAANHIAATMRIINGHDAQHRSIAATAGASTLDAQLNAIIEGGRLLTEEKSK